MEPGDSMTPEMEASGEDIMLMETVKSMVTRERPNESEGTDEDLFLISQDQIVQYPGETVAPSRIAIEWMHLCRICANASDRMVPIFEGDGVAHDLSSKILKYLPIHVSGSDTLPLQLCENCANILIAWHALSEGCLSAQRKLLELQETQLRDKQQYYNPTSLDNLEVTTPMLTIASTTIASNITNLSPNQQDSDKNEVHDTVKNNKSDRVKNEIVILDRIIAHTYFRQMYKVAEHRNKVNPIQTKTSNVTDGNSGSISSPADNIDNNKLTEHLSPTSTSSNISNKLTNDKKKKSLDDKDSNPASQTRASCMKRTKATRCIQQEHAAAGIESNEHLEKNVEQFEAKKTVCTSPPMVCKFCNKKFRSRKSYWAHIRTHSGEKSYTCHICGKQFVQGGSLYYHLKHVHDGVKNHTCDICGRSFAMKTAMEDHRRIHTGERPYVCHTCGKTFKTKASLYIHSKIHTDEFPYKCTYCAKRFRWRQQMLSHLTVHTGEKNHTCDVCGKGFGVKNDLTRHKRVHSEEKPYTCQQCGISFGQKRYLKSHERLKLGTCRFSQNSNRIESDYDLSFVHTFLDLKMHETYIRKYFYGHPAEMHRVLSFQMTRNIDESSEYVTKRLCFSFLFSVGFLCLLCGFLLGRFAVERSLETQAQKARGELAGNGLRNTEYLQQLALLELNRPPLDYDRTTNRQTLDDNLRRISGHFSNLSFVHKVFTHASCIRATVRGSREPDRYIILSVNEDGIAVALELARVLNRISSQHDWRPRRSLVFCVSLVSSDVCPQALPAFMWRKVVAYVRVHGRFQRENHLISANNHAALFGSDVMRFVAVEAIKTIPGDSNWTYLEHEIFGPRLPLDIPQVIFSFNDNNLAYSHHNQNSRLHDVTLAQMISQTVWRLSESTVIQWEPRYFNETVNRLLNSIDASRFQDAKEKLTRTFKVLLAAVKELNVEIDATDNSQMLRVRIWNDLLLDLDKALLCPDEIDSHSRTDLATFRESIDESTMLAYLDQITECYEDAIQVLQER
ncbi:PREDICTED: uncharacterized protein LOC105567982 [Vollenhovia emeryi]|uniref:uncharacterized protein LOC105567982 n=1 Tax=Vollenhovia emeryi TaxID=411798 RepID=UPI0005F3B235|nr:PREDICTED: uncharacterized protein LOC105567982 [Vollenhovia emeryi]